MMLSGKQLKERYKKPYVLSAETLGYSQGGKIKVLHMSNGTYALVKHADKLREVLQENLDAVAFRSAVASLKIERHKLVS